MNPLLEDFTKFCKEHAELSFWQALRNWSEQDFILFGNLSNRSNTKDFATIDGLKVYVKDAIDYTEKK